MIVTTNMKFDFTSIVKNMKKDRCATREIKEELKDIIQTGEYFPENVIDCEVVFCE